MTTHYVTTRPVGEGLVIATCSCGEGMQKPTNYGPVAASWRREHYRAVQRGEAS